MAPVAELQIFSSGVLLDPGSDLTIFVSTMKPFCLADKNNRKPRFLSHSRLLLNHSYDYMYFFVRRFKFYPSLCPGLCDIIVRGTNQVFMYSSFTLSSIFDTQLPNRFFPLFIFLPFSISLTLSLSHVVLVFHRMRSRCFMKCRRRESRGQEG